LVAPTSGGIALYLAAKRPLDRAPRRLSASGLLQGKLLARIDSKSAALTPYRTGTFNWRRAITVAVVVAVIGNGFQMVEYFFVGLNDLRRSAIGLGVDLEALIPGPSR
jgi:hypothetical protein